MFIVNCSLLSGLALDPNGEHHIGKVLFVICRGHDDGAEAVGQLQRNFLRRNGLQGIGQIADIEADFQLLAVPVWLPALWKKSPSGPGVSGCAAMPVNSI